MYIRALFPILRVLILGLDHTTLYTVHLRAVSTDNYKYKYRNDNWWINEVSNVHQTREMQVVIHPDSPASGNHCMKKPINFKFVRITNSASSDNGNVSLVKFERKIEN